MSTTAQLHSHSAPKHTQKGIVLQCVIDDPAANIATIAGSLGMQTGTVSARINDLQRDGYIIAIETTQGGNPVTVYRYEQDESKRKANGEKFALLLALNQFASGGKKISHLLTQPQKDALNGAYLLVKSQL